jgi:hypothetical protein
MPQNFRSTTRAWGLEAMERSQGRWLFFERLICGQGQNLNETASQVSRANRRKSNICDAARRKNAELRTRKYLTDAEVANLTEAAKANRWGHLRDHDPCGLPARPAGERIG